MEQGLTYIEWSHGKLTIRLWSDGDTQIEMDNGDYLIEEILKPEQGRDLLQFLNGPTAARLTDRETK